MPRAGKEGMGMETIRKTPRSNNRGNMVVVRSQLVRREIRGSRDGKVTGASLGGFMQAV